MNKSKKIEVNDKIKPNIINGLDFTLSSFKGLILEDDKLLSFFFKRRLGKSLITLKFEIKGYYPKLLNKSLW